VDLLRRLAQRQPDNVEAWFALGRAHGMLNEDAAAETAFRRAAELRPDLRDAHLNVALALLYQGRPRAALPASLEARRLSPGDREVSDTLLWALLGALQDEPQGDARPPLAPLGPEPLVSVVIPTRDRPAMLRDALESVARQRYERWEALVVNDGGEEVSAALGSLPDALARRTVLLEQRASRGAAAARNRALGVARGEVLAFLDDDDLYLPEHLAALVAGLRASGAPFAYTRSTAVEERIVDGRRVELRRGWPREYRVTHGMLQVRNLIPTANWGARRECFARYGQFDESLPCAEDWDLLLRLSACFALHPITQVTAEIRVRPDTPDSVTRRVPLRPVCEQFYRRYPSGHELIALGRAVYLEGLD
jgi:hypothetical protein